MKIQIISLVFLLAVSNILADQCPNNATVKASNDNGATFTETLPNAGKWCEEKGRSGNWGNFYCATNKNGDGASYCKGAGNRQVQVICPLQLSPHGAGEVARYNCHNNRVDGGAYKCFFTAKMLQRNGIWTDEKWSDKEC